MSSRVMVLLILSLLAVALYVIGFKTSSFTFIAIAAGVELWFWFKLLFSKEQESNPD